jgi:hypothetical protein
MAPIDDVNGVLKKIDLSVEEIIEYLRKNVVRAGVCLAVLFLQFLFILFIARTANWRTRGFICKIYIFLKVFIVLAILEILRWSDALIKKYALKRKSR